MKQFGELERQEQIALFEAWLDGKEIEFYSPHVDTWFSGDPSWSKGLSYRIKPTQPSVNWDHVNPEYKYLAMDTCEIGYLYTKRPSLNEVGGYWLANKNDRHLRAETLASFDAGTCDWKDSLVKRPDV